MTRKCSVPSCKNYNKIKLHRFPHLEEDVYNEWIRRIGSIKLRNMHPIHVNKYYLICDVHFSDYSRLRLKYKHRRGLKYLSVPTLYLPGFTDEPTEENSRLPYMPSRISYSV